MHTSCILIRIPSHHELIITMHHNNLFGSLGLLGDKNIGQEILKYSLVYKYIAKLGLMDLRSNLKVTCLSILTNILVFLYHVWVDAVRCRNSIVCGSKIVISLCDFDRFCG